MNKLERDEYQALRDMEKRQVNLIAAEKDDQKRQILALGLRFIYRELQHYNNNASN